MTGQTGSFLVQSIINLNASRSGPLPVRPLTYSPLPSMYDLQAYGVISVSVGYSANHPSFKVYHADEK